MKKTGRKIVLYLSGVVLLIGIYELIAYLTGYLFLPEFFFSLREAFLLLGKIETYISFGHSFLRLLISLAVSFLCGEVLGSLSGYFPSFGTILSPMVSVLRAIPTVALILLLAVYVPHFSLYVVFLVLFPIFYQSAKEGTESVLNAFGMEMKLEGKGLFINLFRIILPLKTPYTFLGLLTSLGLGIKAEIMSETFAYTSSYRGIGKDIYLDYTNLDYTHMVALVLLVLLFTLLCDLFLNLAKTRVKEHIIPDKK